MSEQCEETREKKAPPPYRPDLKGFEREDAAAGCFLYAILEGLGCAVFGCLRTAIALVLFAAVGGGLIARRPRS